VASSADSGVPAERASERISVGKMSYVVGRERGSVAVVTAQWLTSPLDYRSTIIRLVDSRLVTIMPSIRLPASLSVSLCVSTCLFVVGSV